MTAGSLSSHDEAKTQIEVMRLHQLPIHMPQLKPDAQHS